MLKNSVIFCTKMKHFVVVVVVVRMADSKANSMNY